MSKIKSVKLTIEDSHRHTKRMSGVLHLLEFFFFLFLLTLDVRMTERSEEIDLGQCRSLK